VYVIYEGKSMGELNTGATEPDENLVETVGMMMIGTPLAEIQKQGARPMAEASARRRLPAYRLRLEPRLDEPPAWYSFLLSLAAILVALIVGGSSSARPAVIHPLVSHIAEASFGSLACFQTPL